jgi:hypothetical protein
MLSVYRDNLQLSIKWYPSSRHREFRVLALARLLCISNCCLAISASFDLKKDAKSELVGQGFKKHLGAIDCALDCDGHGNLRLEYLIYIRDGASD